VAPPVPAAEGLEAAELHAAAAKDMVAATATARAIAEPVGRDLAYQRIRWASSRYVPIFLSPFPDSLIGASVAMRRCRAGFAPCTFDQGNGAAEMIATGPLLSGPLGAARRECPGTAGRPVPARGSKTTAGRIARGCCAGSRRAGPGTAYGEARQSPYDFTVFGASIGTRPSRENSSW
jgi:hypothetical protein